MPGVQLSLVGNISLASFAITNTHHNLTSLILPPMRAQAVLSDGFRSLLETLPNLASISAQSPLCCLMFLRLTVCGNRGDLKHLRKLNMNGAQVTELDVLSAQAIQQLILSLPDLTSLWLPPQLDQTVTIHYSLVGVDVR